MTVNKRPVTTVGITGIERSAAVTKGIASKGKKIDAATATRLKAIRPNTTPSAISMIVSLRSSSFCKSDSSLAGFIHL